MCARTPRRWGITKYKQSLKKNNKHLLFKVIGAKQLCESKQLKEGEIARDTDTGFGKQKSKSLSTHKDREDERAELP